MTSTVDIDSIVAMLNNKNPVEIEKIKKNIPQRIWTPSLGPQMNAYKSKADVLLYGGEPGGGKTSLLLGLAFMQHRRSLIMRRNYTHLGPIVDELIKFNGGRKGFNGSAPPSLKNRGIVIDLGAASKIGDEQSFMGSPHDFIGIDETTQFAESQVKFLMGWLRCADDKKQRKRVVFATNPPLESEGLWVNEMFAPWLDELYINPARSGELRYVVTDENGQDRWVDGPAKVKVGEKMVEPTSRTYISASVEDNPFLVGTGYQKQLDAMEEPYRSILLGGFKTKFKDKQNQIIKTEWIKLAQERWQEKPKEGIPMCCVGVDATGGGDDPLVIAVRYDGWFSEIIEVKGRDIAIDSIGKTTVGHIVANRRDNAIVVVDMGGGYGGSAYELLIENSIETIAYRGASSSTKRSYHGGHTFTNKRSAALWRFGEALDPGQPGGSAISLPPGRRLLADLAAPTYTITTNGIKAETKEDVCKRLGRSTDYGDAVIMCWDEGPTESTHALDWITQTRKKNKRHLAGQGPISIIGRKNRRR